MDRQEFILRQQEAVERMKDTARRSKFEMNGNIPPAPSFVKIKNSTDKNENNGNNSQGNKKTENNAQNNNNSFNFDFPDLSLFKKIKNDKDSGIILGLILLLLSENSDKILLYALIYILL